MDDLMDNLMDVPVDNLVVIIDGADAMEKCGT